MKKKWRRYFLLIMMVTVSHLPIVLAAGEETAGDYSRGMLTKFGRGLVNVVSSPLEIPCSIGEESFDRGAAAGFFTGFGKGTVLMLRRILVGVTEVGTFIIPMEPTLPMVCQAR